LGRNRVFLRTDEQGRFSGSLPVSLNELVFGPQDLEVILQPNEPWHQEVTESFTLLTINMTNLGVLSLVSVYLAVMGGIAWRRQRHLELPAPVGGPETSPSADTGNLAPHPAGPIAFPPYLNSDTPRGHIIRAYYRAARCMEGRLAVSLRPYYTLRNFLQALGPGANSAFAELTQSTEHALYGIQGPEEAEALRAEWLAEDIEKEEGKNAPLEIH
jgi:hypothetical protein